MIKVAFFDAKAYDKPSFEHYGSEHDMQFRFLETKLNEDTVELARGCDAVCVFVNDTVNAAAIDKLYAMGVKLIALRSAGYNNVDVQAAFGKIHVVHVPAYSPYAVAEHAIALLLTSVRRIHKAYNRTREFNFSLNGLTGFDFHGKTVGVIGTGKIGRTVIAHLQGFGCKILAYDLYQSDEVAQMAEYVPLDELYARSDVITLHTNATEENHHLIDAKAIETMKPGVTIINTARGKLIDSDALIAGLESGKIGAAGLDVLENENGLYYYNRMGDVIPNPELAVLRSMPNVILTDHTAFYTHEDVESMVRGVLESAVAFEKGQPTRHDVTDL